MNKIIAIFVILLFCGSGCAEISATPTAATYPFTPYSENHAVVSIAAHKEAIVEQVAEPETKMSILDYYRILPAQYIDHQFFYPEVRMDHIDVLDEENYYIRIDPLVQSNSTVFGAVTMLFKPNGTHVIATEGGASSIISERKLHLLTYDNGKWTDVTNDLIPWHKIDFDALRAKSKKNLSITASGDEELVQTFYFELPRYGTDLKIIENLSGETVLTLKWRNGKFNLR